MHKKEFILRLFIVLALAPLFANAEQSQSQVKESFTMLYAQFISEFQSKNWAQITKHEKKSTKCGFGPGEEGIGCIKNLYSANESCMEKMLFSLKQGCIINSNNNVLSCTSPPQWANKSIIILGARSSFTFNAENKTMSVNSFICGGD